MKLSVWFKGIRGSLLLLFFIGAIGLVISNTISYIGFKEAEDEINSIASKRLPITQNLGEARAHLEASMHYTWKAIGFSSTIEQAKKFSEMAKDNWKESAEHLQKLEELGLHPDNVKRLNELKALRADIDSRLNTVWRDLSHLKGDKTKSEKNYSTDYEKMELISKASSSVTEIFVAMMELNETLGQNSAASVSGHITQTKQRIILVSLLSIVGLMSISFFVSIRASRKLTDIGSVLERGSHDVVSSSQQLASASEQLSSSSQEQASALEEASASLEEISGMVESNSKNAEQSNLLAAEVESKSVASQKQIKELSLSMDQILKSNEKIERLVKLIEEIGEKTEVIDEIVFQTRLLSFNASVEAERAGEHGRGFAVVAQEVGNLAQMSGQSAVQISAIVKSAVREALEVSVDNKTRVTAGAEQCQNSVEKINEVVESVKQILSSSEQIVQACREQTTGLKQIATSVESLNQATQSNAATAEESSASSQSLYQQSESLKQSVAQLKIIVNGAPSGSKMNEYKLGQDSLSSATSNVVPFTKPQKETNQDYRSDKNNAANSSPKKIASGNSAWDDL
jgi:methyl-accepting chemotaxis protein